MTRAATAGWSRPIGTRGSDGGHHGAVTGVGDDQAGVQADVGAQLERQADCLAPVGGPRDDFDVGLGVEQHRQPGAHDGLVVGDEDPDAHRGVPVRGRTASTRQPRSSQEVTGFSAPTRRPAGMVTASNKIRPDPAEQPVLMMQDFGAPAE